MNKDSMAGTSAYYTNCFGSKAAVCPQNKTIEIYKHFSATKTDDKNENHTYFFCDLYTEAEVSDVLPMPVKHSGHIKLKCEKGQKTCD